MIGKDHILSEFCAQPKENSGVPLGVARFYAETGIKEADWRGKHWVAGEMR